MKGNNNKVKNTIYNTPLARAASIARTPDLGHVARQPQGMLAVDPETLRLFRTGCAVAGLKMKPTFRALIRHWARRWAAGDKEPCGISVSASFPDALAGFVLGEDTTASTPSRKSGGML